MIAAQESEPFVRQGGSLSTDNPARGFSFLLPETPAPAPSGERREPDDHRPDDGEALSLDFSDLGKGDTNLESEPRSSACESSQAARARTPTLLDSAPPPPVAGVAREITPAVAREPLSSLSQSSRQERQSARKSPVAGHLARFSEAAPSKRPAAPTVSPTDAPGAPAIKKIQFPTSRRSARPSSPPKAEFTPGPPVVEEPASKRAQAEQAASVSGSPAPRTRFMEGGFRRERSETPSGTVRVAAAATADPSQLFAPPEDLPELDRAQPAEGSWDSDAPTAKELWNQARTGLFQAGRRARAVGQTGWSKSRTAAGLMSNALRERLAHARAATDEHAGPSTMETVSVDVPAASAGRPRARTASSPPAPPTSMKGSAPSHASRLVLRTARSLAAPAAACIAAIAVYQAGTHFLGPGAGASLSKSVPQVPELGELEATSGSGLAVPGEPALAGAKPAATSGPPPLQVEQTKMPEGLSWPGKGLIEVVTAEDELIYVDGVFTGRGPLRRVPVSPGEHELSIKQNGSARTGTVTVDLDRCTRAVFAQAP